MIKVNIAFYIPIFNKFAWPDRQLRTLIKKVMPGEDPLKIDVAQILKDKSPGIAKLTPKFLLNYLRKVIHEEDLNKFFREFGNLHNADLVRAGLTYMGIKYSVHNREAIPTSGRNIFVSNHPLGGLDGLVFMTELTKYFDNIKFPVNDILMNVTNMEDVFLPINKHGSQGRDAAKAIDKAYASDSQILYFPAGLCSRKRKGEIKDLVWHKSFITKAIKHRRTIVPVYFSGRNSDFFYNLSNIRLGLGIKWNLEMLYLVDEMFRQTGKDLHIVFGEGYKWDIFDKSKTPIEWADWLKSKSYDLAKFLPDQK